MGVSKLYYSYEQILRELQLREYPQKIKDPDNRITAYRRK